MFEVRETGNPEVPLYFGEGLRRSLGNAAGCAGGRQMGCAGLSFAWMFLCVETQLGAISWCVRISQTNLELSNAFFPKKMFVLSGVNILCISARLWLQVGSPKRLRSDLNKTACFPPSLFSLSMLRKWYICLQYCLSSRFMSIKFWPGMTHLLPILSQCMSWGRGLVPFPETVPFFP